MSKFQNRFAHRGHYRRGYKRSGSNDRYTERKKKSFSHRAKTNLNQIGRTTINPLKIESVSPYKLSSLTTQYRRFRPKEAPMFEKKVDMLSRNVDIELFFKTKKEHLEHIKCFERPQVKWEVDNVSQSFHPNVKKKFHSIVSLEDSLKHRGNLHVETENFDNRKTPDNGLGGVVTNFSVSHPYYFEIYNLKFTKEMLKESTYGGDSLFDIQSSFDKRECSFIRTQDKLEKLIEVLNKTDVFSINVLQHSYRTYRGFVCLISISTMRKDYVIDTLLLRDELWKLQEPFADPKIVKVMYNSDVKLLFLQRDFSLYVVNLFEIQIACELLRFKKTTLRFMLEKFFMLYFNEKYEDYDWRIRPIPKEMLVYALAATSYVLLLFHVFKTKIYEKCLEGREINSDKLHTQEGEDLVHKVFQISKSICLRRYEYIKMEIFDISKLFFSSNSDHNEIFKNIFLFRDKLSRKNDESPRYYMDNQELTFLVENIPKNLQDIPKMFEKVPKLIKNHLEQIINIIKKLQSKTLSYDIGFDVDMDDMLADDLIKLKSPHYTTHELFDAAGWTKKNSFHKKSKSFDLSYVDHTPKRKVSIQSKEEYDSENEADVGIPKTLKEIFEYSQNSRRANNLMKKQIKKELLQNWRRNTDGNLKIACKSNVEKFMKSIKWIK